MKLKINKISVSANTKNEILEIDRISDRINTIIVKSEPGYPILEHIFKATYTRSMVIKELLEQLNRSPKDRHDDTVKIFLDYEGLDIEVWMIKNRCLRCMVIKRQGYKILNSNLSHDVTNHIRDYLLQQLDCSFGEIDVEAKKRFFNDEQFCAKFVSDFYTGITHHEKQFLRDYIDQIDHIIFSIKLTFSKVIDASQCTPAKEEQLHDFLIQAHRQAIIASKHLQLLSMHSSNHYTDEHSLRSMTQAVPLDERSKLENILNQQLGEKILIHPLLHHDKEIGQIAVYEPYMEDPDFLSELKKHWPPLANALVEVYRCPIAKLSRDSDCITRIEQIKKQMLLTSHPLKLLKTQYLDSLTQLVKGNMVDPHGYMINDAFAKFIVADALVNKKRLYVVDTDREGMLFLNSRVGVDNVDAGLLKESLLCQSFVKRISYTLKQLYPHIPMLINYARRHVDENIIVISIDSIFLNPENERVIEKCIIDHLYWLDEAVSELKEFKETELKSAFDSVAPGFIVRIPPNNFKDPEEVFTMVDYLSEKFKRARRAALDSFLIASRKGEPPPYFKRDSEGKIGLAIYSEEQNAYIDSLIKNNKILSIMLEQENHDAYMRDIVKHNGIRLKPLKRFPGLVFFQDLLGRCGSSALLDFLGIKEKLLGMCWKKGYVNIPSYSTEEIKDSVNQYLNNHAIFKNGLIPFLANINRELI